MKNAQKTLEGIFETLATKHGEMAEAAMAAVKTGDKDEAVNYIRAMYALNDCMLAVEAAGKDLVSSPTQP